MPKEKNRVSVSGIGGLNCQKGNINGIDLVLLDAIPQCTGVDCPAFTVCSYKKDGPCKMRRTFLANVINNYLKNCHKATEWDFYRIGTMLVPLWDQLCRLKIEEFSIDSPMQGKKLHPVYAAVRDTIRVIMRLEVAFRLRTPPQSQADDHIPIEVKEERDFSLYGNPEFYDSLTGIEEEEEMPLDEI